MTNEEALKILNNYSSCVDCSSCEYCMCSMCEFGQAQEVAKEALKKQIAKNTQKVEVQGYMRKHWNPKCCPTCRTQHYGKPKYCDECGQALDWGDVK